MCSIDILCYIFNMMTIPRFCYANILACVSVNPVKCLMKFIHENNVIMTL